MNFTKFEEKTKEFIEKYELFKSYNYDCANKSDYDTQFLVDVSSGYKHKTLDFELRGKNYFSFNVTSDNLEDLFDKAYKVLKGYAPKTVKSEKNIKE